MEKYGPPELFDASKNPLEAEYQRFLKEDKVADTPAVRHAFFAGIGGGIKTTDRVIRENEIVLPHEVMRSLRRLTVIAGFGTQAYNRDQLNALVAETEKTFPSDRGSLEA